MSIGDKLKNALISDFWSAAKAYEDRRLEPLSQNEHAFLDEWVEFVDGNTQEDALNAWLEARSVVCALRNGFRPSEYVNSMREAKLEQLGSMEVDPKAFTSSGRTGATTYDYLELV